jgi:Na+/proline symporter
MGEWNFYQKVFLVNFPINSFKVDLYTYYIKGYLFKNTLLILKVVAFIIAFLAYILALKLNTL